MSVHHPRFAHARIRQNKQPTMLIDCLGQRQRFFLIGRNGASGCWPIDLIVEFRCGGVFAPYPYPRRDCAVQRVAMTGQVRPFPQHVLMPGAFVVEKPRHLLDELPPKQRRHVFRVQASCHLTQRRQLRRPSQRAIDLMCRAYDLV
jgi:hypothetical protein